MLDLRKIYEQMAGERDGKERFSKILDTVDDYICRLKEKDPESYERLKMTVYLASNGYHFDAHILEKAYSSMINDDGSKAPYFPLEDCERYARRNGVTFRNFNKYDYAYTMNMLYSDYCQILGNDPETYAGMAVKFLDDPDAPDGGATKAMHYYLTVHPKL